MNSVQAGPDDITMTESMLDPGSDELLPALRHGPYWTERLLGRGTMTVVHVGRRGGGADTGERFAVKRMLPRFSERPLFVHTLRRQAELGMKLNHPNIARVVDFGEQDGEPLMVAEHVDGVACGEMLSGGQDQKQPVPIPVALEIACEVLEALAYAHDLTPSGVVHRGVSPGNILISAMGEVKLADFGVAGPPPAPGFPKIKLRYMSPEQRKGRELDRRSDIFSLAAVLFEMLAGTPLFTGADVELSTPSPLSDVRFGSLSFELRLVLATALVGDSVERFQDAREFSSALRAFARHAGLPLGRRVLVEWIRQLDIVPMASGTYPIVRAESWTSDKLAG